MTTEPHHVPPPPGEPQPGEGPPVAAARGAPAANFVNVNGRLFAVLQDLDPNNVLMGGFGWLSPTDGGATLHPGYDLNSGTSCNSDEGKLVVAPLAGVVRNTIFWDGRMQGEGNFVLAELDDPCLPGPTWLRVLHLQSIEVAVGQRLTPGQTIGRCGRTGGWDCAHAHTELLRGPPANGPWQWPMWWSRAQVEAAYYNPRAWWDAATALVLAEGGQPVPPETVQAMTDWEVANWVLATLYEWANAGRPADQQIPFDPDSGLSRTWVAALRAGHYPGRPRTGERGWGDPQQGVWAEFDYELLVWRKDDTKSWTG